MNDRDEGTAAGTQTLADLQHWTWVLGKAQQMMLEHGIHTMGDFPPSDWEKMNVPGWGDPGDFVRASADFWSDTMKLWQRFLDPATPDTRGERPEHARDKRFRAPQWREEPLFDFIRQSYFLIADHMLKGVDALPGMDSRQKERIRFATKSFVDAMSPTNFAATNPQVIERIVETRGENLLKGLQNMLSDLSKGQLTQSATDAFRLGENIAATPGKVVHRTPLYELIQYAPTTETVAKTPLIIFPPWINRFYILDLSPEKSFIKWAVDQGISVFVVSWKSADASIAGIGWDGYVEKGQIDAIDTVRALLKVDSVNVIGYCVAGTALAATLAVLAARGEAAKVASATFFTAQVDFAQAGDLSLFVDDEQLAVIESLNTDGYLDGRFMAATFNLLRGRDLIWNYVTNNYLLGEDYAPFDLLYWNADVTNLPGQWHLDYLRDLYRDNMLVRPGAMKIAGERIDLTTIKTPAYVQAGREDHIAPAESVWKMTEHLSGPIRFVLAGSGHIAGVVNPPAARKYQYWTNPESTESLTAFMDGAKEHPGSWWPDWREWIAGFSGGEVKANGARMPGSGRRKTLGDAPGSYVRQR
ncbi:PHA/PHB synthase family protein [Stakelama pacifica]|uniref:Polyhydroxyalkanoate synthase n=1 Tax=Stakelama pacifica TaxID=517720 RepID=A0A4R6FJS0_9SPHN|nr:class I poly(R)-hydroxyalkanoic acid synthase [Stakelama pacifica]TDN81692.1 polyhydroxyalkanoate synthase [Stakelama pacifica]GGO96279.1 class I poly(R)-hydroxyalkanoic acid synthase [Stakelama pacifica]